MNVEIINLKLIGAVIPHPNQKPALDYQPDISINKIVDFIDWKPFFEAWELYGNFPQILEDKLIGKAAKDLWSDANKMLEKIIKNKLTIPKSVVGFWPANSIGDDVILLIVIEKAKFQSFIF